ncbi:hypothetical protein [Stenotrophomonas sp. 24(2023)]|uniref:hypothetical protein n=1 Tax=Stenotrophomonas sp. 24(2023) TaxID=3068324 RepID=UPI0027E1F83B|nr:hypothetical protein [Stenotrophomonas sp. 24(2023)]WMJ68427.1 hypothetical protein Q9R17_14660 [Stenotrophomonas sp. 24(2023)]
MKKVAEIAGSAIFPGGYIIAKTISSALADSQAELKDAEGKSIESLQAEAAKQKIVMDFQAHQALVAQEVSIAERITSSEEVEIEEYYEGSGKGSAGLKAEESSVTLGLSGEGRKVTKRIIRFKGWRPSGMEPTSK